MLALFFSETILNFSSWKICYANVYYLSKHLFFSHNNRSIGGISTILVMMSYLYIYIYIYTHRGENKKDLVVWDIFLDFLVIKSYVALGKSA